MSRRSSRTLGAPNPECLSRPWFCYAVWKEGPAQRVQNQRSIHLIVPQIPPVRRRKAGLWEGAGGWRGQQGVSLISKAGVQARPECAPASDGGGCASRPPCRSAALGQSGREPRESSGAWRRKIADVCAFQIHKRKALLNLCWNLNKSKKGFCQHKVQKRKTQKPWSPLG